MTTDHRAQAEALTLARPFDATEHLLAAIHDGQQEQTALLRALVEQAMPQGDPCPCGCRRDVEPKPFIEAGSVADRAADEWVPMDERCPAALNVKGEHFGCDQRKDHYGWAHSSRSAETIWSPTPVVPTDPEPESVTVTLPVGVTRSEVVVVERKRLEDVVLYPGSPAAQTSARVLRDALDAVVGSQS